MDRERAINLFIDEIAKIEKVTEEYGDSERFKEYKEALEFALTELQKDNLTVPIWIKLDNWNHIQGYLDKSREIIFDRWMTTSFAEHVGYEWEEMKEEA